MSLPVVGWRDLLKVLERRGFRVVRQKGSHLFLDDGRGHYTTLPKHNEIKKGTLLKILEQAGIDRDEFITLLQDR
ncbi:MAG: type II toxin-antitoxin system HicA family toxin [Candidatus Nitrosocaldus sp.]